MKQTLSKQEPKRTCSTCGSDKTYVYPHRSSTGIRYYPHWHYSVVNHKLLCQICSGREYEKIHRKEIAARAAIYRRLHPDRIIAARLKYRPKNIEYCRRYYREHKDELNFKYREKRRLARENK